MNFYCSETIGFILGTGFVLGTRFVLGTNNKTKDSICRESSIFVSGHLMFGIHLFLVMAPIVKIVDCNLKLKVWFVSVGILETNTQKLGIKLSNPLQIAWHKR